MLIRMYFCTYACRNKQEPKLRETSAFATYPAIIRLVVGNQNRGGPPVVFPMHMPAAAFQSSETQGSIGSRGKNPRMDLQHDRGPAWTLNA